MANIYQERNSCYAQKEGVYVPGSGVNSRNAPLFIKYILRDLRRGWTYDHYCNRIEMTPELAAKRLRFLVRLARRHSGEAEARKVAKMVREALHRLKALA